MTVPMPGLESATVIIWVKTGSRREEKRINGISHFLEHMVFKGSEKRASAKEISETVDAIGGEFNAATSKDWTNFYIKARVGSLETAFDVLSDMVLRPILAPEEIEREKGTIVQEIAMYEDTPAIKIQDVFENLIFSGNSLAWDVAGDAKSVRTIQKDDFVRYRSIYYHPENMLVTVSGGVDRNEVIKLAEKYFGKFQIPNLKSQANNKLQIFKPTQGKPQYMLKTKKTDQTNFILGFLGDPRGYKNKYVQSVLSGILGGGMSSRLFIEVRERRGLAYSVRTSGDRFDDIGYFGAYAGVDPKKAGEAISVILDQYYGISNKQYPITNGELKKAKEYIKGHVALSLEDTNAVADFFGEQELFLPKVLTPEEIYQKIDAVTIDEVVLEAKRLFNPKSLNLAIIGPYKDGQKFIELLK